MHFDCVERIMRRHGVFLDRSKMEPLLLMLGLLNQNFEIRVRDFINFIDKNSVFPELKRENCKKCFFSPRTRWNRIR